MLLYVLAALALGGYTTYLLATVLPRSLLDRASRHGRFAGLQDDAPVDISDTKSDAATPARPVADANASRC
jgi:hypothetical protein